MGNDKREPALVLIKPIMFYSCEKEKIKLNWFCYELSMEFYDDITESLEALLDRNRIDDREFADFCVYAAKKMKCIVLEKLSGRRKDIEFSYEMVEYFFPKLNDKDVDTMLTALDKAWKNLLDICVDCPVRCISERNVYCTLFDTQEFD